MPCRYGNYKRISPDCFGHNVGSGLGSVRKPNSEIARTQTAQLLGQRHLRQTNFYLRLFGTASS